MRGSGTAAGRYESLKQKCLSMNPLARNGSGTAPADLWYRGGNFLIAHRSDSEAAAEVPQTKMWAWIVCFSREKANCIVGAFISKIMPACQDKATRAYRKTC